MQLMDGSAVRFITQNQNNPKMWEIKQIEFYNTTHGLCSSVSYITYTFVTLGLQW